MMHEDDLDQVHAIEVRAFTTPWTKKSMRTMLLDNEHSYCIVHISGVELSGYAFTWIVADEMHIANIAVHEAVRRRGIGDALMHALIEAARGSGCSTCWLEVRKSNTAARRLYEKLGFREMGIRKRYYTDTGEDAVVMGIQL